MLPFGSDFAVVLGATLGGRLSAQVSECDGSGILLGEWSFDRAFLLWHEPNVSGIACCGNCLDFKMAPLAPLFIVEMLGQISRAWGGLFLGTKRSHDRCTPTARRGSPRAADA